MKLFFLLFFCCFIGTNISAQSLIDDFSDGNFTANPTWGGSTSHFIVNGSNQLQTNNIGVSDTSQLSVAAAIQDSTFWEFYVQMNFSPSTTNRCRIYLQSNNATLNLATTGYYLQIGATGATDSLEIFRVDASSVTKVWGGTPSTVAVNPMAKIRVIRNNAGLWQVWADYTGGTTFVSEGTFTDATHTTGTHFGFWTKYTTTNGASFFFDDVFVSPLVVDVTPPAITSVTAVNSTQVDVLFDETVELTTANTSTNYTLNNGATVSNAARDGSNLKLVHLTTSTLTSSITYTLTVNAVQDLSANAVSNATSNFIFYNVQPAAFQDIVINEILADISPVIGLPSAEFVELLNRSNKIIDLGGMLFNEGSDKVLPTFLLFPDSTVVLTATANVAAYAAFGTTRGILSMSLTDGGELLKLKDAAGVTIDSVDYNTTWYQDGVKAGGGWSLELINPNLLCLGAANWIASNTPAGGTPAAQNSVYNNTPDTQGPVLSSATFLSNTSVELTFNESLNSTTANNFSNYSIAGLTVSGAVYTAPNKVVLTVSPMVSPTTYTVVVANVTDCSGNVIGASNSANFTYVLVQPAAFQDIIINEILADISPQIGLPNAEYVEFYNRSNKHINLNGMLFNDGSDKVLPNFILAPDSFVIITSPTNVTALSAFGTTIGISSISLTDGGELLKLKNAAGATIDSVDYNTTWYQDAVKDDGGWSLELINPNLLCLAAANWIASNNVAGGTPGKQNSVYNNTPDTQGPSLLTVAFLSNTSVELTFNEGLDVTTANNIANYSIAGLTVSAAVFQAPNKVVLTVSAMTNQTTYTVVVANVTDCSGNVIGASNSANFTYVLVQPAAFQDIIINEIHADPSPVVGLPDFEFVELYNRSNKVINLNTLIINDASDHSLPNFLLHPDSFVTVTANANVAAFAAFGATVGVSSITLTNGGELITLKDVSGQTIDSVEFNISWYRDGAKDDGGWTLELINPNLLCQGAVNWIASNNAAGGTPSKQNSVYNNTPDTQGPSLTDATFLDGTTILLSFNEALGANITTLSNYTVSGATVTNAVATPTNKVTLTLAAPMVDLTTYTVTVSNISDCTGNLIGSNNIDSFVYYAVQFAAYHDLIITEIFADPTPVVGLPDVEYVEIYNRSNKTVDLANYTFFETTNHILSSQIMLPNTYAILCAASNVARFTNYGITVPMNSLSLTNSGELLLLYNSNGVLIDSVEFSSNWYQDNAKDDGGWSLELINPNISCKGAANWIASIHSSGGTPGTQNSVFSNASDTTPPAVVEIRQYGPNQIYIKFNDVMSYNSVTTASNYAVNNGMFVITVVVLSETEVILTLGANMTDQVVYTVNISNVSDCVGNIASLITSTMTYYESSIATHYDIIVNEIMADPNPVVGLPEKEYVELYNRSNRPFNLQGFSIKDKSSVTAVLPFFILQPGAYVTVYSSSDTISFASFGNVLPVSPFPDLNTSDEVILKDPSGEVIDAVSYELFWYKNADKDDGGWSLERINPEHPCESSDNWRASESLLGGTPSSANSILQTSPDVQAPDALRALPLGGDSIRVYFSEAMGDVSSINISNYSIDNGITVVSARLELPFYNSVVLKINQPLVLGTIYVVTMSSNLKDCMGNPIMLKNTARFALPQYIQPGDIILNEVLFNPVTSGKDFIELYNKSNKVLNAADLVFSNAEIVDGNLVNTSSLQTRSVTVDWLIFPNEYVVITSDVNQVKGKYYTPNPTNFVENSLPTYDDKEGHVFLYAAYDSSYIDPFGNTQIVNLAKPLDLFDYQESFHSPLIDDKNGVSLERIDFDAPTNDRNNWHSAATEVGYATPAYQNSSFVVNNITGSDLIELPTETVSPDGDGYEDFLLINYNVDNLGYVANIDIYDATGRLIRNLVNGELLMREGSLQWDGTDNQGRKARVGIHILAVEIFNPNGDVQRFKKTCVVAGRMSN